MNFGDMNWQQVEEYIKHDDRVMLVLGACEQHSTLSLLTDSKIPLALAEAVSQQSGVLVAPPLHFGVSPYFLTYPGSISLKTSTYLHVVEDIVSSLYGHGFRRILILNGHGGNTPAKSMLVEFANDHPDLTMRWYAWWLSPAVAEFAKAHGLEMAHANWEENFTFTRIGDAPQGIKPRVVDLNISGKDETRRLAGDGSYGGAYQVNDRIMQELFDLCLGEVLDLLQFT
jgi:creatinine amidohydrolase